MPIEIAYEQDGEFVKMTASGTMTDDDIYDALRQIYGHPDFEKVKFQLANYSDVSKYEASKEATDKIIALDKQAFERNPYMRVAIVASTFLLFETVRYWELSVGHQTVETNVFQNLEAAEAWLFAED